MHKRVSVPVVNHKPVPNYRMLVIREGQHWVSMVLDHWMCTQGNTRREAVRNLQGIVTMSHAYGWIKGYDPAPAEFQKAYRSRRLWTGDGAELERPQLVRVGTKRKAKT